jgi:hypothetical protein
MTARSPAGIFARGAERELVQIGLADDDGSRFAQTHCDRGVAAGDVAGTQARRRRGGNAFHVHEILERDRQPVEWSAIAAAGDLLVGVPRGGKCFLRRHGDEGIQLRLQLDDARERFFGERFRSDLTACDARRNRGDGLVAVRHLPSSLSSPGVARAASSFQSAARSAAVDFASPSRSAASSGNWRRNASIRPSSSHCSIVMISP